jgi:WD40 repeat protein
VQNYRESVAGLLWSRDGRYVLAATSNSGTSRGISIWNAEIGRHRGELIGCPTEVKGLVRNGDKFFAGCADGGVRVWDTGKTFEQVKAFEKSLKTKAVH